jgi:hypothetical protein
MSFRAYRPGTVFQRLPSSFIRTVTVGTRISLVQKPSGDLIPLDTRSQIISQPLKIGFAGRERIQKDGRTASRGLSPPVRILTLP